MQWTLESDASDGVEGAHNKTGTQFLPKEEFDPASGGGGVQKLGMVKILTNFRRFCPAQAQFLKLGQNAPILLRCSSPSTQKP